jgi:predicted amino acid racemase
MSCPRLEIDISKIRNNTRILVQRMAKIGISVTGVTKAFLGLPEISKALIQGGVSSLGDSRIETIESMRLEHISTSIMLIRSPMLSQTDRVVMSSDISFNTELEIISQLSASAKKAKRTHGIVLMVELGDLREGIMPEDIEGVLRKTLQFPNIVFKGIGANLACRSGVSPSETNMGVLSHLATSIEAKFGLAVEIVSGGNSANIQWASSGVDTGRVNNLRLGEAILFGREALERKPIEGLSVDAFSLVAEVIESQKKPSQPTGRIAQSAFGEITPRAPDRGVIMQNLLAIGRQDTEVSGLLSPAGLEILGASSDHLILEDRHDTLSVGSEVAFDLNYAALLKAMTSPFVTKVVV